jgi:hypothetical protein
VPSSGAASDLLVHGWGNFAALCQGGRAGEGNAHDRGATGWRLHVSHCSREVRDEQHKVCAAGKTTPQPPQIIPSTEQRLGCHATGNATLPSAHRYTTSNGSPTLLGRPSTATDVMLGRETLEMPRSLLAGKQISGGARRYCVTRARRARSDDSEHSTGGRLGALIQAL